MAECLCNRPCGENCKCKCHDKRVEKRADPDLIGANIGSEVAP